MDALLSPYQAELRASLSYTVACYRAPSDPFEPRRTPAEPKRFNVTLREQLAER